MTTTPNYYEFLIYDLTSLQEDLVSSFCFELGAGGISENLQFTQNFENYEPVTIETQTHNLIAYFEQKPTDDFTAQFKSEFPDVFFELREKVNKDWMAEWKKGFQSFSLVEDIWVVPSWEENFNSSDRFMKIDPGMAFGTGTHATTQLAAQLIYDLYSEQSIDTVFDVGTGTGILAMLCEMLGAKRVTGTEIDEVARQVAKENILDNQSKCVEILDHQLETEGGRYDLVIANIIDGVLVQIQKDLKRLSNKYMVLTGILDEREQLFLNRFQFEDENKKFKIIKRVELSEWVGFLVELG